MKPSRIGAALALGAASTALFGPALAVEVGVSVQISQPGVYGRIDIGRLPLPQLVLPTPVIIAPPPPPRVVVGVPVQPAQPIYMWVPPGHQKNWGKHCRRYNACGVPVYFVQDGWYHDNVYPQQGKGKGNGKGHGRGHGKHD